MVRESFVTPPDTLLDVLCLVEDVLRGIPLAAQSSQLLAC